MDFVHSNYEKSLLEQCTSWATSQREIWLICSKQKFKRELTYAGCITEDGIWRENSKFTVSLSYLMAACFFRDEDRMSSVQREYVNLILTMPKHWYCVTQSVSSFTIPLYVSTFHIRSIKKIKRFAKRLLLPSAFLCLRESFIKISEIAQR